MRMSSQQYRFRRSPLHYLVLQCFSCKIGTKTVPEILDEVALHGTVYCPHKFWCLAIDLSWNEPEHGIGISFPTGQLTILSRFHGSADGDSEV